MQRFERILQIVCKSQNTPDWHNGPRLWQTVPKGLARTGFVRHISACYSRSPEWKQIHPARHIIKSVPANVVTESMKKLVRHLINILNLSPSRVWHKAIWQWVLFWRAAYRSSPPLCRLNHLTDLLLGSGRHDITVWEHSYPSITKAGVKTLTSNVVSFWIWSTISDLRGEMTTVTPGDTQAGSW